MSLALMMRMRMMGHEWGRLDSGWSGLVHEEHLIQPIQRLFQLAYPALVLHLPLSPVLLLRLQERDSGQEPLALELESRILVLKKGQFGCLPLPRSSGRESVFESFFLELWIFSRRGGGQLLFIVFCLCRGSFLGHGHRVDPSSPLVPLTSTSLSPSAIVVRGGTTE